MQYYAFFQKKETLLLATGRVSLEDTMLSEIDQTYTDICEA